MMTFAAPHHDPAARRKALREHALHRREQLPAERRERLSVHIGGHLDALSARLQPRTLGFCWPYRAEPDLRPWVQAWLAAAPARVAALPVVQPTTHWPSTHDCPEPVHW